MTEIRCPRFILINGAPRAGKDTIGKYIFHTYGNVLFERFSRPHKEAFAALTDSEINEFFEVEGYEERKSERIPWLGASFRQWQIDFSETFMKPRYGNDIFGRMMVRRTCWDHTFVVPDCGFQIEVDCLRDYDCILIQVARKGCTFVDDSRNYVQPAPQWAFHHINNDGTLDDLAKAVDEVVKPWIERK